MSTSYGSERHMLDLLHRRYAQRSANGGVSAPRYICAEHVRTRAGFDCRTMDFAAVDTWQSSMENGSLAIHGVEVKVSRSDWLRELKDPQKSAETMQWATHRWLAVPLATIARPEELPEGWGLLVIGGSVLDEKLIAKVQAKPVAIGSLTASATAALLRAAVKTATRKGESELMTWFRLDDSFYSHPKVLKAGNEAVGLYVRCGTYAAAHVTDGFVDRSVVTLYGSEALAARLVDAGLWHRTRGGWNIHDYLDYNPSREAVEKERKAKAERQKRWREGQRRRVTSPSSNAVSDASKDAAPPRPAPKEAGRAAPAPERPAVRPGPEGRPSGRPENQSVADALGRGIPGNYRPAPPDKVTAAAAAARQALRKGRDPG